MLITKKINFRVVAIIAARNEELCIETCIRHLASQGIDVFILDNDSEDKTLDIAKSYLGKGVIGIERQPYLGYFDLAEILLKKEHVAKSIQADWFMHYDTDEIREAPLPYANLREAIFDADQRGYNAINFDEFVFMPGEGESFENRDYVKEMTQYYFFEPNIIRHIKAWKKNNFINLVDSGGHKIKFRGIKIFPVNFILRHYIILSLKYAAKKYCIRNYFKKNVIERGWHGQRATIKADNIILPPQEILKVYKNDRVWDKSDPWRKHYFLHYGERY